MRLSTITFTTALLMGLLCNVRPAFALKVPFDITEVSERTTPIDNMTEANDLLANPSAPSILLDAQRNRLRFANAPDQNFGPFQENNPFPRTKGFDGQNFVLHTSADLFFPTAGNWTFGVASDDGFSVTVDGQSFGLASRRAAHTTLDVISVPAPGNYPIEVTYFQRLEESELEVFAAPGTHSRLGGRQGFHLINGNSFEALQVVESPATGDLGSAPPDVGGAVPEPATFSLMGFSMTMLLMRRKK